MSDAERTVDEGTGAGRSRRNLEVGADGRQGEFDPITARLDGAGVEVVASWLDDEDPYVTVRVVTEAGTLRLPLSTTQAQYLSADLREAATEAERGAEDLAGSDE